MTGVKIIGECFYVHDSIEPTDAVVFEDCVFFSDPEEHAKWLKSFAGIAWLERQEKRRAAEGPSEETITQFARTLILALESCGPESNYIVSDTAAKSVLIDGTFDLHAVVKDLLIRTQR